MFPEDENLEGCTCVTGHLGVGIVLPPKGGEWGGDRGRMGCAGEKKKDKLSANVQTLRAGALSEETAVRAKPGRGSDCGCFGPSMHTDRGAGVC